MGTTDHFSRQMKMKQKTFKLYQSAGLQKMIGRTVLVIYLAGRKALTSATMTAEEIAGTFVELIKEYNNDKADN